MLHNVRFLTKGTETHVFLDEKELHGCISAHVDYQINELPVVTLELSAIGVRVESELAEVSKTVSLPIEVLGLSKKTVEILHNGYWWNKNNEQQCDPVLTVDYLVQIYKMGHLGKYKGLGPCKISNIVHALRERELI